MDGRLLGRKDMNRMRISACLSSKSVEWATPKEFFNKLDDEFHFNLDPCSTHENAKCEKHYTIEEDGLSQDWGGVSGILQPSLWKGNLKVGQKVLL